MEIIVTTTYSSFAVFPQTVKSLSKTVYLQEIENPVWKLKKNILFYLKTDVAVMDIMFIKWNIDFGFRKLIETWGIPWREFWLWKLTLNFVHFIEKNKNCTFLDTFTISDIVILLFYSWDCTAISTMYWDFYHTSILLKQIMVFCQNTILELKKKTKKKAQCLEIFL